MFLRRLKPEDAPLMLEWMHDKSVTADLKTDFSSKTIHDAERFIEQSCNDENLHLAIVTDDDEYMGTVSLKHINTENAEFAIAVRRSAMGKGFSKYGMEEILKKAAIEYGTKYVYWCVDPDNKRAVRFYDKNGYIRVNSTDINISDEYSAEQKKRYYWYKWENTVSL